MAKILGGTVTLKFGTQQVTITGATVDIRPTNFEKEGVTEGGGGLAGVIRRPMMPGFSLEAVKTPGTNIEAIQGYSGTMTLIVEGNASYTFMDAHVTTQLAVSGVDGKFTIEVVADKCRVIAENT